MHSPPAGSYAARQPGRPTTGAAPIAGFYFLYYGAVGVTLPFLPVYLKSLSLSGAQVGVLLALGPLFSLLSPLLWGHLADRFGRPDRLLTIISLGAAWGFAPLLLVDRFPLLIACLAAYSLFASAVTPLIDSLALQRIAAVGGNFSHLRLFGSLGFVLSSGAFGFAIHAPGARATVAAPLALIAAYFLWSFTLRARAVPARPRHPLDGLRLLRSRGLSRLLAATSLHWIACAPYHGIFSIHVAALGLPPRVVGLSASLGVIAEVAVMVVHPRLAARLPAPRLLLLAFFFSALRWAGMAWAVRPEAIIALSLLHGMTFGAFYVGAIAYLARHVPEDLRASGQAIFASATFGIGGLVGYLGAGAGYDAIGGHRLFAVATGLELVAAALARTLGRDEPVAPAVAPAGP